MYLMGKCLTKKGRDELEDRIAYYTSVPLITLVESLFDKNLSEGFWEYSVVLKVTEITEGETK